MATFVREPNECGRAIREVPEPRLALSQGRLRTLPLRNIAQAGREVRLAINDDRTNRKFDRKATTLRADRLNFDPAS